VSRLTSGGKLPARWISLKAGPAAPLTLHFLVALFKQTFAFAILAFLFWFARDLRHAALSDPNRCLLPGRGEYYPAKLGVVWPFAASKQSQVFSES
jgi:hypothetical protein